MTAKEMFERLGYEYNYYPNSHKIICFLNRDYEFHFVSNTIIFYKKQKTVKIEGYLNLKELQAINKQVEELGWKK